MKSMSRNLYTKRKEILIELQGELLYGLHPIRMALKSNNRTVHKIFYNRGSEKAVDVAEYAKKHNIETHQLSRGHLDELTRTVFKYKDHHVHQGVAADVSRMYPVPIDFKMPQFPDLKFDYNRDFEGEKFILLLYNIQDPMNLGAILRTCQFFGCAKVVLAAARPDLSAIVSKASSGALELMSIFAVRNLTNFLETLKQENWNILTLASPETPNPSETQETPECPASHSLAQVNLEGRKTVLIVGSEGSGIPAEVSKLADMGVFIPSFSENHQNSLNNEHQWDINAAMEDSNNVIDNAYIDSINVSVAVGIAMFHLIPSVSRIKSGSGK